LDLPMICTVALLTVKRNFFFQIIELYNWNNHISIIHDIFLSISIHCYSSLLLF
jgi:hypothetical protein